MSTAAAAAVILPPLPCRSPATATPILPLLQSSSSCRISVAATGEQRSSRAAGLGWYGVQCRQSPTQKSSVGIKICQPNRRLFDMSPDRRHVADMSPYPAKSFHADILHQDEVFPSTKKVTKQYGRRYERQKVLAQSLQIRVIMILFVTPLLDIGYSVLLPPPLNIHFRTRIHSNHAGRATSGSRKLHNQNDNSKF